VVVTVGLVRLGSGALAQVEAARAAPGLVEEVGRLVSRHFHDGDAADRVWGARAVHSAALAADPTTSKSRRSDVKNRSTILLGYGRQAMVAVGPSEAHNAPDERAVASP
jgi:hypothetical protein